MRYFPVVALFVMLLIGCQSDKKTYVEIQTDMGNITIMLYDETPIHKENFIKMVEEGYYDGTLFHRIIDKFMIQGGDPDSRDAKPGQRLGMGGPGYTIDAEIGAPHLRGAVAGARTSGPGNPEKKSSGSQFYIVHGRTFSAAELDGFERMKGITYNETQRKIYMEEGGAPSLDMDYTVFGEVVEGLDVVDQIVIAPKDSYDRPVEDIRMNSVKIVKR